MLAARDVISYERGGWVLVSRQLGHDQVDDGVRALLGYFNKRIGELIVHGFDPADTASFYTGVRPPYEPIPTAMAGRVLPTYHSDAIPRSDRGEADHV